MYTLIYMEMLDDIKHLFSPKGRIGSRNYGILNICVLVLSAVLMYGGVSYFLNNKTHTIFLPVVSLLISIILIISSFFLKIKRLHDVGVSGWFMLVPVYGWRLLLLPGTPTLNRYDSNFLDTEVKDKPETVHNKDLIFSSLAIFFIFMLIGLAFMLRIAMVTLVVFYFSNTIVSLLYKTTVVADVVGLISCLIIWKYYEGKTKTWMIVLFSVIILLNVAIWASAFMLIIQFLSFVFHDTIPRT